jgi:peptidoglycan/xylan/chitin deacetylase (PgdA/CDA1 family)
MRTWIALVAGAVSVGAATVFAAPAFAADCPGHPDALGTSRVLVVDPLAHPHLGAMQYRETLPLQDHEVVLTFDDGPLPKYSNKVRQILADQCVKATFFTIGRQAQANPEGVRKLAAAGHTVGTHSQNHPLRFDKMTIDQAKPEVDQGIASVSAALTDPSVLAPFFRVPGLRHGEAVETYAAQLNLQVWSADFVADDWRSISGPKVYELAMKRLEARGRGILLLHDIHERTVAALPMILSALKARGYRIVHVVPATAERPATATDAQDWLVHRPSSDKVPVAQWPSVATFDLASAVTRPDLAPADLALLTSTAQPSADQFDGSPRQMPSTPMHREAQWPQAKPAAQANIAPALPVPAAALFEIPHPMPVAPQRGHLARSDLPQPKPAAKTTPKAAASKAATSKGATPKTATDKPSTRAAVEKPSPVATAELAPQAIATTRPPARLASLKKR